MIKSLRKGRYAARLACTSQDVIAAQRLRHLAFVEQTNGAPRPDGLDADIYDDQCQHILVEDRDGTLVCCFRMMVLDSGNEIERSYSAQYYDLTALKSFDGKMVEMGRFCIHPAHSDPQILRVAWGAMTKFVDDQKIEMLFGCSSFMGTEAETYSDSFTMLSQKHLAPRRWLPRVKAPKVFRFAERLRARTPDRKLGMKRMPPLLKTYLTMGGWVSDHAVVDTHMNTLHVFTGVEIRAIPPARARLLRAAAGA